MKVNVTYKDGGNLHQEEHECAALGVEEDGTLILMDDSCVVVAEIPDHDWVAFAATKEDE